MSLPGWARVLLAFAAYATALALAPVHWLAHPSLWSVARAAPYWASAAVCVLAWATRKDEGPGGEPEPFATAPLTGAPSCDPPEGGEVGRLPVRTGSRVGSAPTLRALTEHIRRFPRPGSSEEPAQPMPSRAPAQVAAVLTLSGVLDLAVGALAGPVPWEVAQVTSAATWALVAAILARCLIRSCARLST